MQREGACFSGSKFLVREKLSSSLSSLSTRAVTSFRLTVPCFSFLQKYLCLRLEFLKTLDMGPLASSKYPGVKLGPIWGSWTLNFWPGHVWYWQGHHKIEPEVLCFFSCYLRSTCLFTRSQEDRRPLTIWLNIPHPSSLSLKMAHKDDKYMWWSFHTYITCSSQINMISISCPFTSIISFCWASPTPLFKFFIKTRGVAVSCRQSCYAVRQSFFFVFVCVLVLVTQSIIPTSPLAVL